MTLNPATLRTYASIFSKPKRHEHKGKWFVYPPSEIELAAANALNMVARIVDLEPSIASYYSQNHDQG